MAVSPVIPHGADMHMNRRGFVRNATLVTVGAAAGNWVLNSSNYFGFRFVAADGLTHYGWGRFVIGASISGADRTIAEIAYEDVAATAISVGDTGSVPAPGAIALLGLAGLAGRRRR